MGISWIEVPLRALTLHFIYHFSPQTASTLIIQKEWRHPSSTHLFHLTSLLSPIYAGSMLSRHLFSIVPSISSALLPRTRSQHFFQIICHYASRFNEKWDFHGWFRRHHDSRSSGSGLFIRTWIYQLFLRSYLYLIRDCHLWTRERKPPPRNAKLPLILPSYTYSIKQHQYPPTSLLTTNSLRHLRLQASVQASKHINTY